MQKSNAIEWSLKKLEHTFFSIYFLLLLLLFLLFFFFFLFTIIVIILFPFLTPTHIGIFISKKQQDNISKQISIVIILST